MNIAFTVCNRTQLPHALCLGQSLLKHNPLYTFVLGWVDSAPLPSLPEWVKPILINEVEVMNWEKMKIQYFDFELVAACIPFFARHILRHYTPCVELIYFSPSVFILHSLDPIIDTAAFLQLTPHRTKTIKSSIEPEDSVILNIGMFHRGSWILHPDGQEMEFLDWWCERTQSRAYFDLCHGMYMEQLWLNYAPIYHCNVKTIRMSGWHYGLHNTSQSPLNKIDNEYFTQNFPILTVDFAGLETYDPTWSDYSEMIKNDINWQHLIKSYQKHYLSFSQPEINDVEIYGKPSVVKSYRTQRKKAINSLKKWIERIENYNLTYN